MLRPGNNYKSLVHGQAQVTSLFSRSNLSKEAEPRPAYNSTETRSTRTTAMRHHEPARKTTAHSSMCISYGSRNPSTVSLLVGQVGCPVHINPVDQARFLRCPPGQGIAQRRLDHDRRAERLLERYGERSAHPNQFHAPVPSFLAPHLRIPCSDSPLDGGRMVYPFAPETRTIASRRSVARSLA
jgi:hypothetical protein